MKITNRLIALLCIIAVLFLAWKSLMSIGSQDEAYKNYLWPELFTPFGDKNQSLYAVITRLVWHSEKDFIGASNQLIRSITSLFSAALLALLFLKRLPAKPDEKQDRALLLAEFSLYPMLMLFASPVSQVHHYTTLYLIFLAALLLLPRYSSQCKVHFALLFSVWIAAAFVALGMVFESPLGYLGTPLWGSLLLWGVVLFCLNKNSAV